MSAKWRSLQHRHRYTYSAIVFPQYYKQTLDDFINLSASEDHDASARVFYSQLNELVSLNSTYAQLSHAKKIAFAFTELLKNSNEAVLSQASRFYLEILFLENSVPLHRTLVSVLAKTRDFQSVISDCFRSLCEEYADVNGNGNGKRKRFCVSRVGLSMMSSPKLGYLVEVVEECAILMSLDVVSSLNGVVLETNELCRPSPIVMEQCQEALSCIYYLLQRCPSKFTSLIGSQDSNIIENIITTILSILKSEAFSRDCFVAAGVSFCASLQVCLCPEELGLAIIEGIFHHALTSSTTFQSIVMKIPYKGNLFSEIHSFSLLSRLCLIRGILTSVPRTLLDTPFASEDTEMSAQTILYNGILPELCKYCENPTDSHFNFHALTVMQICLQQIKTLLHNTKNHDPVSDDIGARILRIIWNNLEDPLSQTVKQVHLIFDIYIDIQSSLPSTDGKARVHLFLKKITSNLLRMGSRCKGRYVPLSSLTKRLGAKAILQMCPDMMFETAWAYIDDDVCCAATTFLKCFLESLRDEFWSSDGVEIGYKNYRNVCLPPFLQGLASGNSKLRSNLNTYAFPVILEVDVDSIFPMLAFISVGPIEEHNNNNNSSLSFPPDMNLTVEQKVAVLVSLLKVSRSLALIEGDVDRENTDYALVCVKGVKVKVLINWLVLALTHVDEFLRTDAVESLFLNPKTASLPSSLELSMMKEAMPLNMRCSSTSFQMKLTSLFRKFFSRVKTALERQIRQGTWKPNTTINGNFKRADELFQFMKWLSSFLFFSCYPSAPYERKIMAMELILIMNNTWPIVQDTSNNNDTELITPYDARFTSPESTLLLVGSIVDSWDRLRENSFRILLNFPTPLPGMLTTDMVKVVIIWAKNLVYSPRVRESDAGALTMRLIFRKYVLDLGWIVKASTNSVSCSSESSDHKPVVEYVVSLVDWLQAAVEMGEKDLSDACRNSFVHGVLLTLRYSFEELDWSSDLVMSNVNGMRYALEKLLELVMRITSMALSVVSADAWHIPDDDMDDDMWQPTADDQVVMVGCWLAMKEVSLLLGTIIRKIPLPTSDISNHSNDVMLDFNQLETIGNHFLEVLMKMKHNGAIDKTRAGFTALCNRLLCSDNPRLSKLPEQWMEQLMERTIAKGQTVDDLLRRSAGIPAAFIAFFLSEPEGTPKRLLPRALQWLINLSNKSVTAFDTYAKPISKADPKVRDEGVIPTVHAFNVLKAAFNDTNLATDTSGFSAEAMIIAIRSFSSVYWEVRNSACLIKWMDLCLHMEMVNLLSVERNHRCVCYILKILFAWNQKSSVGITDSGSVFLFWEKLVSLYKTTRHMKTRESLLCCMAVCVKQFSHMFIINSNHKVYDSIAYYVDLVKLHSNASETVNIRKAVAESIIASGLLQTVESIGQHVDRNKSRLTNMYASRTLEVWSTCIKLLEDEDVSLRSKLAIDVQKCFTSDTYGIPSQVDKVMKSSFDYLTLVFGQWVDYFDYLCEWVLSASDNVVSRGDLVRRVFDKEVDNHHEEKLLVCQICCFHLEKVNGGLDLLCDWRRRFLRRLVAVSGDRGGGKQAVEWIGGLGNHKDAFLAVYSNLLGVYAMSKCILKSRLKNSDSGSDSDSDSGLMLEMAEVGDVIKPFLGNPLINNLFLTVVRLHEESFGQLCDSLTGDEALWDRFDPYFLLR